MIRDGMLRATVNRGQDAFRHGWYALRKRVAQGRVRLLRRLLAGRVPHYLVLELSGGLPERTPPRSWYERFLFGAQLPVSMAWLRSVLRQIAVDPDLRGVVLVLRSPALSLAKAQSLADAIERLRKGSDWHEQEGDVGGDGAAQGRHDGRPLVAKEVVVYLEQMGPAYYWVASAADRVYAPAMAEWDVRGLRSESLFLGDALAWLGIEFEALQIAPWKTGPDTLVRSNMSEADREQRTWLLRSLFGQMVTHISRHRGLPEETVSRLIDRAPLHADRAREAGLLDGICYEDELPDRLAREGEAARLATYAQARALLYPGQRFSHHRRVGVLDLSGTIVPGPSRSLPLPVPLLGSMTIGHTTVQRQVRAALRDRRLAAVVVHVDSPGGSSLASDLIWREIERLAQRMPVVIYMGRTAASGGYYISTPGHAIVAQPATLTGSIGVYTLKPVLRDAYSRLKAHPQAVEQGANAGLYSEQDRWTPEQRAQLQESVMRIYDRFTGVVVQGRGLDPSRLQEIGLGRVWTGEQAREHGLVDELGDFPVAVHRALTLARLPVDGSVPVVDLPDPGRYQPPGSLPRGRDRVLEMGDLLVRAWQGEWQVLLGGDRFWLWADGLPRVPD